MTVTAQILLYNFKNDERTRPIRRYLNKAKITVHMIQAPDYLQPLGYLFGLPGFSPSAQFNLGGNFQEEMLVMKDFTEKQMDDFFRFFKANALAPVELKAILTPVNQHWNSLQLHKELLQEHKAMNNDT